MKIQKNVKLASYTTFRIGGAAKFFCEAKSEKEILEAVKFARENNLPIFVLGGGSNVLVSDKGFNGVVIKIQNSKWRLDLHNGDPISIECGAGCQLGTIVNESIKDGLTGLEWAAGIPGTIGGAVRGNAGAFGGCMADCVESVEVLEIPNPITNKSSTFPSRQRSCRDSSKSNFELRVTSYELRECKFSYRDSIFKQNPNSIILSVALKLKKGNKAKSQKLIKEILSKRKEKQPMDFPSAGSFFKNPVAKDEKLIAEFEKDTGTKIKDSKTSYQYTGMEVKIPAGYLVERVGLRGKKIGGAMVSEKHANFLMNTGNAKAEDFIVLAAIIKTRVRNKFGIQLKEEVQMVGF